MKLLFDLRSSLFLDGCLVVMHAGEPRKESDSCFSDFVSSITSRPHFEVNAVQDGVRSKTRRWKSYNTFLQGDGTQTSSRCDLLS